MAEKKQRSARRGERLALGIGVQTSEGLAQRQCLIAVEAKSLSDDHGSEHQHRRAVKDEQLAFTGTRPNG